MRVWDISPGYLNLQSLLGEHCELHAICSIISNSKKGYSRHPETIRWQGYGWALQQRHRLLAAELSLRGLCEKSPVNLRSGEGRWPAVYIDEPGRQFELLKKKYAGKEKGRIALPKSEEQLWAQHKYSVLARNPYVYRKIGRNVSTGQYDFFLLAAFLTELLRMPPNAQGIRNAAQHMWGYFSDSYSGGNDVNAWPLTRLLQEIQKLAMPEGPSYITDSTALSDLTAWLV
jgi:hypothetical protein